VLRFGARETIATAIARYTATVLLRGGGLHVGEQDDVDGGGGGGSGGGSGGGGGQANGDTVHMAGSNITIDSSGMSSAPSLLREGSATAPHPSLFAVAAIDPSSDLDFEMTELVFPQHTQHHGTTFGGVIMSWAVTCAVICAERYARSVVEVRHLDEVIFREPSTTGDRIRLRARVNWSEGSEMEVRECACARDAFGSRV
jgi:hypothetical protein